MELKQIPAEERLRLNAEIFEIILEKGPAHATMDMVAQRLGMSKRTLYEIFGSKDAMILQVLDYHTSLSREKFEDIFRGTPDSMTALRKVIEIHVELFKRAGKEFFRDMDIRTRHLRPDYYNKSKKLNDDIKKVFILGTRQGVFREDLDYDFQLDLFRVQMESLKRMEDNFPHGITLAQAYKFISMGFLRSIATPYGLKVLEESKGK